MDRNNYFKLLMDELFIDKNRSTADHFKLVQAIDKIMASGEPPSEQLKKLNALKAADPMLVDAPCLFTKVPDYIEAKLKAFDEYHKCEDFHYFSSSALHWRTDTNIIKLVNSQKRADRAKESSFKAAKFAVWRVPVHVDSNYEIDNYAPQVEGAEVLFTHVYGDNE
jgi:hypothetical protein